MHKVLYYSFLNFQESNINLLNEKFEVITLKNPEQDSEEVLADIEIAFAPLGFYTNKEKIDKMPKLKIIASNTTGETHIDREYAESKGIKVISLKGENEFLKTITSTAEHTWGLLLALMRRTPWAFQSILDGKWNRWIFGGKAMLSQMTIGIVGLGRLGTIVANYAKCFGLKKISYYDPYVSECSIKGVEKINSLEELVGRHDIITIHIPAEKETYKMFNADLFSKFKPGSYFINTSRGELVDEEAMIKSLESGILAGAAIDVLDEEYRMSSEELLKEHPLLKYAKNHDNLLITPHIGGSTLDAWRLTEEYTIRKILEYLNE